PTVCGYACLHLSHRLFQQLTIKDRAQLAFQIGAGLDRLQDVEQAAVTAALAVLPPLGQKIAQGPRGRRRAEE
ncbi:MAG TPA: hypothetical protein VKU02_33000, partial [Gemmataceae bacterium]|nr:hypothetical protein [Gemmataceae bacterium]